MHQPRLTQPATITCLVVAAFFSHRDAPTEAAQTTARRPNIVVILADDLGYADVGFNGCPDIPTPNIDTLARQGVRCSSGYVSHPFCSPTRAGLLTGRYQQRFGHENNPTYDPTDLSLGLPTDQTTLAQVLRASGYVTGAIGKWHLGAAPRFHPNRRGFDEYFGFLGGGHIYLPGEPGSREYQSPILRNNDPVDEREYLTDAFSREAVRFIERHARRPFFLYLAYNAVHTPLQALPKYRDRFPGIADNRRRTYAAMQGALDDGVGRVLEALRDQKLDRDTLVFFLSDNGGPPTANGARNDPLRGTKGQVYEGGIHVPFVVRWRGTLPEGAVLDAPVISLDIFPTAVAAAGGALPAGLKLDGVNILPALAGDTEAPPHERLFWREGGGAAFAVREGRFKLVRQGSEGPQLFDLAADPTEANDLAGARPDVVDRLEAARKAWNAELIAPLWEGPQPAAAKKQAAAKKARATAPR
jgi:arylsulfatase A-like enzyme